MESKQSIHASRHVDLLLYKNRKKVKKKSIYVTFLEKGRAISVLPFFRYTLYHYP